MSAETLYKSGIERMSTKRFRIAFSFAGEKRDFVAEVATILAQRFSQDKVLYDKYHKAEFAVQPTSTGSKLTVAPEPHILLCFPYSACLL